VAQKTRDASRCFPGSGLGDADATLAPVLGWHSALSHAYASSPGYGADPDALPDAPAPKSEKPMGSYREARS
jgi:hypothetical protein